MTVRQKEPLRVIPYSQCMDLAPLDWRPDSVYLQAGGSRRDARVAGVGLRWNSAWPTHRWGISWSGALDFTVSGWSAPVTAGGSQREHTAHWALVPIVRWQPHEGRSPWFAEAGLGLSLHHHRYRAEGQEQSSRWNFQEVVGVGRQLGDGEGHAQVSLRLSHFSNGGLRRPNPGETWWTVRWSHAF